MIASLRGTLLEKQPTRLVVETGGVGFEVHVPLPTGQAAGEPGDTVFLHTVLVVREDALTLYGFETTGLRSLFRKLTSVSGIGPRIALNALSGSTTTALVRALRDEDLGVLTRLPGIGKKTAQRMVVELKDGLEEFGGGEGAPASREESDALAALLSLGYTRAAAQKAVREAGGAGDGPVEEIVRRALARLNR